MNDEGAHNIWRSYSDMMSGLLLLFVLIMAVCLMQAQKNYNDKLAEQASRLETQDELEQTQSALSTKESELEQQSLTLTDLQNALELQAATLSTRESELAQAQATLEEQRTLLAQQESELEVRDAALVTSQQKLDEQNELPAILSPCHQRLPPTFSNPGKIAQTDIERCFGNRKPRPAQHDESNHKHKCIEDALCKIQRRHPSHD